MPPRLLQGAYSLFLYLHLLGVFGAGVLLLGVPYFWFAEHWYTHRRRSASERVPLRSFLARSAYFGSVVGFGITMLYYGSDSVVIDQVWSVCAHLDKGQCDAWPLLPADKCKLAQQCGRLGLEERAGIAECDGYVQPNFRCRWTKNAVVNHWTATLLPDTYWREYACERTLCPLNEYARGVALEFAVLLLTVSYVSTFGLHDVKRLLDRPPPNAVTIQCRAGTCRTHPAERGAVQPLTAPLNAPFNAHGTAQGTTQGTASDAIE